MLEQINKEFKHALKNKNTLRISTLRQLKSAIDNKAIALKKKDNGLSDDEVLKVLKSEAKKRKDAISAYKAGGRPELVDKEKEELEIINEFLPEQMPKDEIIKQVDEVINQLGSAQFGQVMAEVMKRIGSKADGSVVSKIVKEKLSH